MSTPNILPCPFCNHDASVCYDKQTEWVRCLTCEAEGPQCVRGQDYGTESSQKFGIAAIKAWNHAPRRTEAEKISVVYSRIIREWLSEDEMNTVLSTYRDESYGYVREDDFCDSNQALIDAWAEVYGGDSLFVYSDDEDVYLNTKETEANMAIVDEARAIARKQQFYPQYVTK